MDIEDKLKLLQRLNTLDKLLPSGCDKIMAAIIMSELCVDLSILPFNLEDLGIDETGYNYIISKLSFNVYELTEEEKDILFDYCLHFFVDELK